MSEALIQGSLPRPAELEVYLGEDGIYCRPLVEQPVGVAEGSAPDDASAEEVSATRTPLYMFE